MPLPSWTDRDTFFYLRIAYGDESPQTLIELVNPVHIPAPPTELGVRAENYSLAGYMERLHVRDEIRLTIQCPLLFQSEVESLRSMWNDWAKYGNQMALTLDRRNTAGGQDEYDNWNTFFDRAELLTNPFAPQRRVISDIAYAMELVFRQGADESLG